MTTYTLRPETCDLRLRLREPPPEPLNESELSWIWSGQRFPSEALGLVDGRRLRVISPGRAGGGSGPDFLDAMFEVEGELRRGDVELHVRASSFRDHGHDTDPAYDGVALHVVFRADEGPETRLSNGCTTPVAAFAPWLEGRAQELQTWLSAGALWHEPCRDAVREIGEAGVRAALLLAGERRFETRVETLRAAAEAFGPQEAVWRALCDSLGVGGDREGFRRLTQALTAKAAGEIVEGLHGAEAVSLLTAALCHAGGLASEPPELAGRLPQPLRPALSAGGRPANRPQRRLLALATLYVRAGGDLAAFAVESVRAATKVTELTARWQVAARDGAALLGPDRARELALNVVLPFAALQPDLKAHTLALVTALPPAPVYGKTAFLEANLRATSGKRLVRGALEQQGLLSYLSEWCSRGGCGMCPLSVGYSAAR